MKASDYIAGYLAAQGIPAVFEVAGGMIAHLLDSLHRLGGVRRVSVHHEQAAAFAADAVGRVTGIPGVALATSGPGATNLLTGIGSCYFDSSPAVFITGQVNRNERKGDRPIRQLGFQETDIAAVAAPLTKAAWRVESAEDLPRLLDAAFSLAVGGRPGPVLLDIPMDIQRTEVAAPIPRPSPRPAGLPQHCAAAAEEVVAALLEAERPLILAGGGVRAAAAQPLLQALAERTGVPVVSSLLGLDLLPFGHPLRVGMLGTYGNRWANLALGRADLLVVLGSRLDIRQTGADVAAFQGDRVVFHVDCDPAEINNRLSGCRGVVADLHPFLEAALGARRAMRPADRAAWTAEIEQLRNEWPDTGEIREIAGIHPNAFIHQLSRAGHAAAAYVADVGQNQMWAAQSLELDPHQRFLTSGGMGAMGFALPAAVGASMALGDAPVVAIAGDGGFQLNLQELETVAHHRLPVKMVVLNNRCQGMVRQFQQSYFEERYPSTYWGYSAPRFARIAAAYGIPARTVHREADVDGALAWLWQEENGPALLEVMIETLANVYPKIAFGRPMTEMEPLAVPVSMEAM